MISTTATVFAEHPEVTLPRLSRRFMSRYESARLRDGRVVLDMPSVGTVTMTRFDDALRLDYVIDNPAMDFAARTTLESFLRRVLRGVVFTVAWEESGRVPASSR